MSVSILLDSVRSEQRCRGRRPRSARSPRRAPARSHRPGRRSDLGQERAGQPRRSRESDRLSDVPRPPDHRQHRNAERTIQNVNRETRRRAGPVRAGTRTWLPPAPDEAQDGERGRDTVRVGDRTEGGRREPTGADGEAESDPGGGSRPLTPNSSTDRTISTAVSSRNGRGRSGVGAAVPTPVPDRRATTQSRGQRQPGRGGGHRLRLQQSELVHGGVSRRLRGHAGALRPRRTRGWHRPGRCGTGWRRPGRRRGGWRRPG
ncbi:hypothetical protein FrEUN1fDRAFT_5965 [Parafrankia sp. EUN1f]|nr:hypothetical protein FrEUN1fDRAFT_5965 [Parafrankia sp. EUN1f]